MTSKREYSSVLFWYIDHLLTRSVQSCISVIDPPQTPFHFLIILVWFVAQQLAAMGLYRSSWDRWCSCWSWRCRLRSWWLYVRHPTTIWVQPTGYSTADCKKANWFCLATGRHLMTSHRYSTFNLSTPIDIVKWKIWLLF